MPFALSVIRGELTLSDCPLLTEQEIGELQSAFTVFDWREELISRLQKEISNMDLAAIAPGIGAELKNGSITLKCMGREFTVSPSGELTTRGPMTPWVKILLLHYIRTSGSGELTGRWVSFSELRGGMVKFSSFTRDCEQPMTELFDKDFEKAASILSAMGAKPKTGFTTEKAWELHLLPKIPVTILYWPGETNDGEEFPAKLKVIFDSTADRYLDVESLIFLVEGLARNMERQFGMQH